MKSLNHQDISQILQLIDDSPYHELTLKTDSFTLLLQRQGEGQGWTQQQLTSADTVTLSAGSAPAELIKAAEPAPGVAGLLDVRSPMVGTWYEAPKPGADAYVQVGSKVEPNTVIGIIEVMKLMSSVPAGLNGEIAEILVADAQLVAKDQLLMRVKPAAS